MAMTLIFLHLSLQSPCLFCLCSTKSNLWTHIGDDESIRVIHSRYDPDKARQTVKSVRLRLIKLSTDKNKEKNHRQTLLKCFKKMAVCFGDFKGCASITVHSLFTEKTTEQTVNVM